MRLSEACSKVWIGQSSSAKFPIQSRLKQDDALGSLLFNFALETATGDVLVNQQRLKSKETHQLLIFADSFNLLGSNPNNIYKKNTGAFVITSKEIALEVKRKVITLLARRGPEGG